MDCQRTNVLCLCLLFLVSITLAIPRESAAKDATPSTSPTVDKIVISLNDFQLLAKNNGKLVKAYPIATGTDSGPTPTGTFRVVSKLKNPWFTPDDEPAQAPGPNNPLGTRWIGINKPHYGLHGTNNPNSIGTRASEGCIRLFNRHVEKLYDMVEKGTTVTIRESFGKRNQRLVKRTMTGDPNSSS